MGEDFVFNLVISSLVLVLAVGILLSAGAFYLLMFYIRKDPDARGLPDMILNHTSASELRNQVLVSLGLMVASLVVSLLALLTPIALILYVLVAGVALVYPTKVILRWFAPHSARVSNLRRSYIYIVATCDRYLFLT